MAATALRGVTGLSPARALRQPRRLDARALVGVFLAVLSTVGALVFWSATSDTREVLVATRELPAGAVVGVADLAVARVRVDDTLYGAALPASERSQIVGRQLAASAFAQQVLVRAQFADRPPLAADQFAMTIPVAADSAVGGRLRPGDAVQVLVTLSKGKPESRTYVALPRVTVYDTGYDESAAVLGTGGMGSSGAPAGGRSRGPAATLTLAVTQEQALELARARWNGDLDVVLAPPPPAQNAQGAPAAPAGQR